MSSQPVAIITSYDKSATLPVPRWVRVYHANTERARALATAANQGAVTHVFAPGMLDPAVRKVLRGIPDGKVVWLTTTDAQRLVRDFKSHCASAGIDYAGLSSPVQRAGYTEQAVAERSRALFALPAPTPKEDPMPREPKWTVDETAALEAALDSCKGSAARFVAGFNALTDGKERDAAALQLHLVTVATAKGIKVPDGFMQALDDLIEGKPQKVVEPVAQKVVEVPMLVASGFVEDPDWVTGAQVEIATGFTAAEVRNMANRGLITKRKAEDGTNRYPLTALKVKLAQLAAKRSRTVVRKQATPLVPAASPTPASPAPTPAPRSNDATVATTLAMCVEQGIMTPEQALAKALDLIRAGTGR